ncbi:MAG: GNAT family protein [Gammaproteobacteria bacterium]
MPAYCNDYGQPIGAPLPHWRAPPRPPRAPLAGQWCVLEPLVPARHAEALFAANARASDDRAWTYLPYGPFAARADYRAWMEAFCVGDDPLFFAIVAAAEKVPLGLASYLRIAPAAGSIEVGHLNFSPLLQRTPAATEAMYLMMRQVFALGYRRFEWKCDALNAPSRRAAQRLGLSFEGVFRQATVYKERNRDTAWYAATDADWPALAAAFERWLAVANFDPDGNQRESLSALTAPLLVCRG